MLIMLVFRLVASPFSLVSIVSSDEIPEAITVADYGGAAAVAHSQMTDLSNASSTFCVDTRPYGKRHAALLRYLRNQGLNVSPRTACLEKGGIVIDFEKVERTSNEDIFISASVADFTDTSAHVGVRLKFGVYHLKKDKEHWRIVDYKDLGGTPN